MTWTTTLPDGTTRIRMLPNILQQRWTNIEQGEVPADKWQLQQQAGNPVSISGAGLIYTKAGGGGNSELFYEDDDVPPNICRLTRNGGVGYLTQKLYGNGVVMKPGATEITNPQQAFCCAFAFFSQQAVNGNYPSDAGFYNIPTYDRTSTGHYTINLGFTATSAKTYVPLFTMRKLSSSQIWQINIVEQDTTFVSVRITENGTLSDGDFCCAIFGAFT